MPTTFPTLYLQSLVNYRGEAIIAYATTDSFTDDYRQAFRKCLAGSLVTRKTRLTKHNVAILGIESLAVTVDTIAVDTLGSDKSRHVPSGIVLGVRVRFVITYIFENLGYRNLSESVTSISNQIRSAFLSGELNKTLRRILLEDFGLNSTVLFTKVDMDDTNVSVSALRTNTPSSAPTDTPRLYDNGPPRLVQIALGSLLTTFLLLTGIFWKNEPTTYNKMPSENAPANRALPHRSSVDNITMLPEESRDDLCCAFKRIKASLPGALQASRSVEYLFSSLFTEEHAFFRMFTQWRGRRQSANISSYFIQAATMLLLYTLVLLLSSAHPRSYSTLIFISCVTACGSAALVYPVGHIAALLGTDPMEKVVPSHVASPDLDEEVGSDMPAVSPSKPTRDNEDILIGKTPLLEEVHRLQNRIGAFHELLLKDEDGNKAASSLFDDLYGVTGLHQSNQGGLNKVIFPRNMRTVFETAWGVHDCCSVGDEEDKRYSRAIGGEHRVHASEEWLEPVKKALTFTDENKTHAMSGCSTPLQSLLNDLTIARNKYDDEMISYFGAVPRRTYASLAATETLNIARRVVQLFFLDVLPLGHVAILQSLLERERRYQQPISRFMYMLCALFLGSYTAAVVVCTFRYSAALRRQDQISVLWCFLIWFALLILIVEPLSIWIRNYAFARVIKNDVDHILLWLRCTMKDVALENARKAVMECVKVSQTSVSEEVPLSPRSHNREYLKKITSNSRPRIQGEDSTFPPWAMVPNTEWQEKKSHLISLNAAPFFFASNRIAARFSYLLECQAVLNFRTPWPKRVYGASMRRTIPCFDQHRSVQVLPAQWLNFSSPVAMADMLLQDGLRQYFAEYLFLKVTYAVATFSCLPLCLQDILLNACIWIVLYACFVLHVLLYHIQKEFVVFPVAVIVFLCIIFMKVTCRPCQNGKGWINAKADSRVHIADPEAVEVESEIRSILDEYCHDGDSLVVHISAADAVESSTMEVTDTPPVAPIAPIAPVLQTPQSPPYKVGQLGDMSAEEDRPGDDNLEKMRDEVHKEIMKQLSLFLNSPTHQKVGGSSNRLPPLLRLESKGNSPTSPKDMRYANSRTSGRSSEKKKNKKRINQKVFDSQFNEFLGVYTPHGEAEELPSVDEFLAAASQNRTTRHRRHEESDVDGRLFRHFGNSESSDDRESPEYSSRQKLKSRSPSPSKQPVTGEEKLE